MYHITYMICDTVVAEMGGCAGLPYTSPQLWWVNQTPLVLDY